MRPFVVALPLAAALTGCSGSTPSAAPAPTTDAPTAEQTTAAPTSTPSPTATVTPSATATATPSRHIPALTDDVDGDGRPDLIQASVTLLRVTLSSTGVVVTAPVHSDDPRTPAVLGTGDIDRDGRAEVFLETAQGASTSFATPYRWDGTTLRELQLDGGPARLGIGGSVTHGDGFRCLPTGQLEVRQAESSDGETFTVHATDYRIAGAQLVLVSTRTGTARQGQPNVESSYNADCGSVGN